MTILAAPLLASLLGLMAAGFFAGSAQSQSLNHQAVGTWTLVSVKVGDADAYGPNPHGIMFLDAGGRFSVSIVRTGVAKFTANTMKQASQSPSISKRAAIRISRARPRNGRSPSMAMSCR
jgi:hypothetical protein